MLVFVNSTILPFQALAQTSLVAQNTAPIPFPRPNRNNLQTTTTPTPATIVNTNINKEQSLTLNARISQDGSILSRGVVWRIFNAEPKKNGEMVLLNKSETSPAQFLLKSGDYIVHASYGYAQVSETINVSENTQKTIILNSGALRLNAAIVGDIPISSSEMKFDVSTAALSEEDRVIVARDVKPNSMINLNAGNYNVISKFGNINARVSADLKVEPGQITDATLYHRAGRVSFKLVSEAGGRAIPDVDWEIKTVEGKTIFTSMSAFPSTILSEGDYSIIAKRGQNIYNRDFSVQPGPAREIEVSISVY